MTTTSGFFNSLNGTRDRAYNAEQMSKLFTGIIQDGVLQSVGDNFEVTENAGMSVQVASGKAWFIQSWIENDASVSVAFDTPHATFDRIDLLVLDFNKEDATRANTLQVVKGTASASPVAPDLIQEDLHWQAPIASIFIDHQYLNISTSRIEVLVGTDACPFSVGILDQVSASQLLIQWGAQFNEWFDGLVDVSDENAILNLQNQIDNIQPGSSTGKNMIINGDMRLNQYRHKTTLSSGSYVDSTYSGFTKAADRWRMETYNTGTYSGTTLAYSSTLNVSNETEIIDGGPKQLFSVEQTHVSASLDEASGYILISQALEPRRTLPIYSTHNDKLTISFFVRTNCPGTYVVELQEPSQGVHITQAYTIPGTSGVWSTTKVEMTFDISEWGVEVGDMPVPSGFLLNAGLLVNLWLWAGTDYTSGVFSSELHAYQDNNRAIGISPNNFKTIGDTFQITEVQLELGDMATEFERLDIDSLRSLCHRFYEVHKRYVVGVDAQQDGTLELILPPLHNKALAGTMKYAYAFDIHEYSNGGSTTLNGAGATWVEYEEDSLVVLLPNGGTIGASGPAKRVRIWYVVSHEYPRLVDLPFPPGYIGGDI